MKNRRELYIEKLQMYYAKEGEHSEYSESTVQIAGRNLWTKQLEVTQHFTRDFVAEVQTKRRGIIGKLVTFIKRIFRKGTYYIFKQFSEQIYDFQSRSMELSGEVIQFVLSLEEGQLRLKGEQQFLREEQATCILNLQTKQQYLEEEKKRLSEEQAAFALNLQTKQQYLEEEQKRLREEQAIFVSDIKKTQQQLEEERRYLYEEQRIFILDIQKQFDDQIKKKIEEHDILINTKLESYANQVNLLESMFLSKPVAEIDNHQMAALYAYRYMLGRNPETMQIVWDNKKSWRDLRSEITKSEEFKREMAGSEISCVNADGITYFCPPGDMVIYLSMIENGVNWAKDDIDHFISLADREFYTEKGPEKGIFLDIGGNIGTTSIYCKLKLKDKLHFIAFEPISLCAKLLAANAAFNGVGSDIVVEQVALSDRKQDHVTMKINKDNWGNCTLIDSKTDLDLEETEIVSTITLDEYIVSHSVNTDDIKYIWLDVEGHEFEVLKGATNFLMGHKVPLCMEFNQGIYREHGHYEEMIQLLEKTFEMFVVTSRIRVGQKTMRPIQELPLIWEEEKGKTCDLILL